MAGLKNAPPSDENVEKAYLMDRRDFLKASSTLLTALTLHTKRRTGVAEGDRSRNAGRLVLPMNRNWRYSAQRVENATARQFDDSGFEAVTIPHTNKRLPWHSFDEKLSQFVSVYRRRFKLPPEARGQHVFIDFQGAMTASTVWVNGQRLGEYKGGYTPFSFDLTPHIDWEGENVLVVELDSSERSDIPPFGGSIDYLTFGGIYRDVWVRLVPATCLENIFGRPKDVLTDRPSVDVSCFVAQLEPRPARPDRSGLRAAMTLEAELWDGDRMLARSVGPLPTKNAKSGSVGGLKVTVWGSPPRLLKTTLSPECTVMELG